MARGDSYRAADAGAYRARRPPGLGPRTETPIVVDRPGVFLSGAPYGPGRLVHWEQISSLVLADMTSVRSHHRRRGPGIGVRLRAHPGVVALRRPLDGWSVDAARLQAAVARFAPPGVDVVAEAPLDDPFTLRRMT